jgi:hypothetical protein
MQNNFKITDTFVMVEFKRTWYPVPRTWSANLKAAGFAILEMANLPPATEIDIEYLKRRGLAS